MKKVNLRLVLILVGVVVGGVVGVYFLHKFQVSRNAGSLAKLARAKLAEGKSGEALTLFNRYVAYRPDDKVAYAEYAGLVLDRAESPAASRNDVARAYGVLETAVRRNPDDDALRQRLATFQMRIGRFGDAREHLQILRTRAAEGQAVSAPATTGDTDAEDEKAEKPLDPVQLELMLARSWAGTGDFEEAASLASNLIAFDLQNKAFDPERKAAPNSTDAFILLAAILQEKFDDPGTADRVLAELVKSNAEDPQAWLALARWHRQRGNLAASKQDVAEATRLAPENIETLLASFEVSLAEKDFAAAQKMIDACMKVAAGDERVIRAAAVLALQRQQPTAAVEVLDEGLSALPGRPSLLMMLADALLQTNDIPRVEQTIGRLKEVLGTSSPAVGLLESRVLIAQQRWLQAREKLDRVRPLVAGSADLTRQVDLYLGQCHEQLGEFDEQLEANRRVLSDDPTSLAARVGAASALIAAGKPDEALQEFETVAAAIPRDRLASIPQVWNPLLQLRVAAQAKRPAADRDWATIDALLDTLQESADITDTQIALLRADVLVRKGEATAATELLETAVEANPQEPQLLAALATLALRENDAERARAILDRAPKNLAADMGLLLMEAQLAARSPADKAAEQLTAVERRAESLPPDRAARVLSALASIRISMGQPDDAERLWTAALEKTPDDPRLRWTLYELARERANLDAMQRLANDIAKTQGATSPQGRVAKAGALIQGVREAQKKKLAKNQALLDLSTEDRRSLDEARNLLIEAENDRPCWAQIQLMFADIAALRGDLPAAIDHLQRASRMGPANASIIRQLVGLLYASNRFDEAQQAIARLGPEGLGGFERITAEMELRSGNIDEAVTLAERSVSTDSKNAGELLWLGQLLSRSGKADRAEAVLDRAVEQAPELAEAWMALFTHQFANGKRRLAEKTLERAAASLAEPNRQLVEAQGYEMLGRLDDAEQSYRAAMAAVPTDSTAARGLASFLIRRGRLNPAREVLRDIVGSTDDSPASKATKIWARRSLAQLTAEAGGYKALEESLAILEGNKGSDGKLSPEDIALQVTLLAGRPEPASWRRAITLLETLGRSQPLSSAQRLQLAQLRERAGRWAECRDEMMSLVAAPNAPPSLVGLLVERLIEHGELSSAKTWLGKLRATNPDAPATLALEAKLAIAEKDRPTAVAAAKKLMPSGDVPLEQVGQLRSVAKLMEELGFHKAADKVLTDYAQRVPDGALVRAEFLGRQHRVEEALDLLETTWSRVPLARIMQAALAVVRSQGAAPDATVSARLDQWFSRARREDPESIVIELLQAELLELQGRSAEIDKAYRAILDRKDLAGPQLAIVANNLAFHLARPETAEEARELIDKAILELGPHPDLLDTRGVVRLAAGDTKGALADLEEAALDPSPLKLLHLAAAQVATKDLTAARQSLDRARKLGLVPDQLSAADKARYDAVEAALPASPGA
ncbi:MAG: tetratricopeptide repeat protein [Planctomycetia bacterium]